MNLDPRSVIGVASFVLVLVVFGLIMFDRSLLQSDAFLILATAVVITGWVNGPVSWAYSATKTGGELAETNAKLIKDTTELAPKGDRPPTPVRIEQPKDEPVPTTEAPARAPARFAWER